MVWIPFLSFDFKGQSIRLNNAREENTVNKYYFKPS